MGSSSSNQASRVSQIRILVGNFVAKAGANIRVDLKKRNNLKTLKNIPRSSIANLTNPFNGSSSNTSTRVRSFLSHSTNAGKTPWATGSDQYTVNSTLMSSMGI